MVRAYGSRIDHSIALIHMENPMLQWFLAQLRQEEGQGLAEYALILAFIAIVAVAAVTFLGTQVSDILSQVGSSLP